MSKHSEQMKEWRQRAEIIVIQYEEQEMSFREIGDQYGISSQRAHQIYRREKERAANKVNI